VKDSTPTAPSAGGASYARAPEASQPAERPRDWPLPGPIDLARHDLPHASSMTEWWYVNTHLTAADGHRFSLFAAFFRIVKGRDADTGAPIHGHSLTWALSDLDDRRYLSDTLVDRDSPRLGLERVRRAEEDGSGASKDPRVRRALKEMFEKGQVPWPDHPLDAEPFVGTRRLELDYDGRRFEKRDDGSYALSLWHDREEAGVELVFRAKPGAVPVRHGEDGVVRGPDGGDMFYYFLPDLEVSGTLTLRGLSQPVSGNGWYDHEFGGHHTEGQAVHDDVAWNWVAGQLSDGSRITAYTMTDLASGDSLGQRAIFIAADGTRSEHPDIRLTPLNTWTSTRTFNDYPTRWRLEVPELALDLAVDAAFDDQELVTLISKPAFWEGRVDLAGTRAGAPIDGVGYVERSGYLAVDNLEAFFKAVGKEVRRSVADMLPFEPTFDKVRDLIASKEREHYMEGVDLGKFVKTGVAPVRAITDRGGKGWRSYAALACCDVVGGDSREFVHWLAMPELMHVGSLIVDDVQDGSTIRRGGPACHVTYGDALAINAGTSCYFMGQKLLHSSKVSAATKLRLYDLYFEALRAGHAGQAADIEGLDDDVPLAVETGDTATLEARLLAIHRLKTAAPAGALARMGALVGGGTEAQVEGLGRYFESLGLAFQMMDDVLNLRGFAGGLKLRGEDLSHGKVTLPVIKALARLDRADRETLWTGIQARHERQEDIDILIALLDRVDALASAEADARALVESAWQKVDPLLEPSIVKLMLRAFGWFVLERYY
jgi:geranylgeranyl pyrophosphate synthase/predicted secreted hydrolase